VAMDAITSPEAANMLRMCLNTNPVSRCTIQELSTVLSLPSASSSFASTAYVGDVASTAYVGDGGGGGGGGGEFGRGAFVIPVSYASLPCKVQTNAQ
jgi:hypothetical protein